jgi:hypothetical protein
LKRKDQPEKAMEQLWLEHTYYEMTLGALLQGITSDADLGQMVNNPRSALCETEELSIEFKNQAWRCIQRVCSYDQTNGDDADDPLPSGFRC